MLALKKQALDESFCNTERQKSVGHCRLYFAFSNALSHTQQPTPCVVLALNYALFGKRCFDLLRIRIRPVDYFSHSETLFIVLGSLHFVSIWRRTIAPRATTPSPRTRTVAVANTATANCNSTNSKHHFRAQRTAYSNQANMLLAIWFAI